MTSPQGALAARVARIVVALLPWSLMLFLHYWFEYGEVWDVAMPYRALISGVMLTIGMVASFLLYGLLTRPQR